MKISNFLPVLTFAILALFVFAPLLSAFGQNKKSDICHKSGDSYSLLNVNNNAIGLQKGSRPFETLVWSSQHFQRNLQHLLIYM